MIYELEENSLKIYPINSVFMINFIMETWNLAGKKKDLSSIPCNVDCWLK